MNPRPRISRREWRTVALYGLLLALITTLPYALAGARAEGGWAFSGFLIGADDGFSYLAKMRLGARGMWDFYLFYTPEAGTAYPLLFLPYIVPGRLVGSFISPADSALPGVLALVFHIMRVAFSLLLVAVLYRFFAAFVRSPRVRGLALVWATLGGGLGWLLSLLGQSEWLGSLPPELFIPEGFTFLILYSLPHLALARAALLAGLLLVGSPAESGRGRRILLAGLCWGVVGLAVPFYLTVIYAILAAWSAAAWLLRRQFPWTLLWQAGGAALLTLPLFIYYALVFSRDPLFAQWSAQNALPSPHPLQYLLAYSLILLAAAFGLRWALRRARLHAGTALLLGWPLLVPLLVYLPINVQRRLSEAVIVPLALLAAVGGRALARRIGRRWPRLLLTAASLSCAFLLMGGFFAALTPERPLFRPAEERAALAWLNASLPADAVVLASFDTGNILPAYTDLRPFVGHGPETLYSDVKKARAEAFFGGQLDAAERQALYAEFGIQAIIYGPLERALAADASAPPLWAADGEQVYDAGGFSIYRLSLPPRS